MSIYGDTNISVIGLIGQKWMRTNIFVIGVEVGVVESYGSGKRVKIASKRYMLPGKISYYWL